MTTLCEHLRASTRREHGDLDRALLASGAFRDPEHYARFLRGMLGFHRHVEALLGGHPLTEAIGHLARSVSADVDLDQLASLGVDVGDTGFDRGRPLGGDPDVPDDVADPAKIAGMLYVVEGSSLGGLHLARLVRRHLPALGSAVSFLDGVGDATAQRWARTTEVIDASGADRDVAAEAARDTFRLASAWLGVNADNGAER